MLQVTSLVFPFSALPRTTATWSEQIETFCNNYTGHPKIDCKEDGDDSWVWDMPGQNRGDERHKISCTSRSQLATGIAESDSIDVMKLLRHQSRQGTRSSSQLSSQVPDGASKDPCPKT